MAKKNEKSSKKTFSIGSLSSLIDDIGTETKLYIENEQEDASFINTGVYILNALFSKSILKGGIPDDRITILAGAPSTGKSYIVYNVVREAQKDGYYVIFIDTEHSINKRILADMGIKTDAENLKLIVSNKIEDLKDFFVKTLTKLKEQKDAGFEIPKILIALDSIGQLASEKEINDAISTSHKADMSRAKSLKQMFRIINSDLGYLKIPMIATNHVYEDISAFFPQSIMSGGKGIEYSASTIVFLSTAKLKSGREDELDLNATGAIITAQAKKNRMAKPKKVKFEIDHTMGTNPFKGLEYFCTKENFATVGIAQGKKVEDKAGKTSSIEFGGNRWYIKHLDKSVFEKQLFTPEVFTKEVLEALEPIIYKYFDYSNHDDTQLFLTEGEEPEETDTDFDSLNTENLF